MAKLSKEDKLIPVGDEKMFNHPKLFEIRSPTKLLEDFELLPSFEYNL